MELGCSLKFLTAAGYVKISRAGQQDSCDPYKVLEEVHEAKCFATHRDALDLGRPVVGSGDVLVLIRACAAIGWLFRFEASRMTFREAAQP